MVSIHALILVSYKVCHVCIAHKRVCCELEIPHSVLYFDYHYAFVVTLFSLFPTGWQAICRSCVKLLRFLLLERVCASFLDLSVELYRTLCKYLLLCQHNLVTLVYWPSYSNRHAIKLAFFLHGSRLNFHLLKYNFCLFVLAIPWTFCPSLQINISLFNSASYSFTWINFF